jgi:hypothetical protein
MNLRIFVLTAAKLAFPPVLTPYFKLTYFRKNKICAHYIVPKIFVVLFLNIGYFEPYHIKYSFFQIN